MNVDLVVTNAKEDASHEDDLTHDLMSIIVVYSSRIYGRRGGESKRMVISEDVRSKRSETSHCVVPQGHTYFSSSHREV
jgi:predicted site-specific integrase-resolvase